MIVFKKFSFDAAHSLPHLPEGHKCRRKHGHTYHVEIQVEGTPGSDGMVIDYALIDYGFQHGIMARLDHRDLDDIIQPSTCENVATWIAVRMQDYLAKHSIDPTTHAMCRLRRVIVRETETAGAIWE